MHTGHVLLNRTSLFETRSSYSMRQSLKYRTVFVIVPHFKTHVVAQFLKSEYLLYYSFLAYAWPQLILVLTWCSRLLGAHTDIGLVVFTFRTICMEIIIHLIPHHPSFVKKVFKGNASKCHAAAWHSKSYVLLSCSALKCFCSIHFKMIHSHFCMHLHILR